VIVFGRQQNIGMYGLLREYICKDWTNEQQQFLYKEGKDGYNQAFDSGGKWATTGNFVLYLWQQTSNLWRNRNEAVHNQDNTREKMETNVRLQYDKKDQCTAFDQRFIFWYDLNTMLRQPTSELKAWMKLSRDWITGSIKQKQQE
jgi:hypothetical protein